MEEDAAFGWGLIVGVFVGILLMLMMSFDGEVIPAQVSASVEACAYHGGVQEYEETFVNSVTFSALCENGVAVHGPLPQP